MMATPVPKSFGVDPESIDIKSAVGVFREYQQLTDAKIELLVVIAIIGVLMTILIPSLQKSKDTVKAAVCMSNLKQAGIGLMRYSQVKKD